MSAAKFDQDAGHVWPRIGAGHMLITFDKAYQILVDVGDFW